MRWKPFFAQSMALAMILGAWVALGPLVPTGVADPTPGQLDVSNSTVGEDDVVYNFTADLSQPKSWSKGGHVTIDFPVNGAYDNVNMTIAEMNGVSVKQDGGTCIDDVDLEDDNNVTWNPPTLTLTPDWSNGNDCSGVTIKIKIPGLKNPETADEYDYMVKFFNTSVDNNPDQFEMDHTFAPDEPAQLAFTTAPGAEIEAGTSIPVTVEPQDEYGNTNLSYQSPISLSLDEGDSDEEFGGEFENVDPVSGTYSFDLWVNQTGDYNLSTVDDNLTNAEVSFTVVAASPSLAKSTVTATSTEIPPDETTQSAIRIRLNDEFGNRVVDAGHEVCVYLNESSEATGSFSSQADGNGDCADEHVLTQPDATGDHWANFTASAEGLAAINATLDGIDLVDGVTITVAEVPVPAALSVDADDETIAADGESTTTITVRLQNDDGEDLELEEETICLQTDLGSLTGSQGDCDDEYVEAEDDGDGVYTSTLEAGTTSGTANVTAKLNSTISGFTHVEILPGDPAKLSFSTEPALVLSDEPFNLTVDVLDAHDNLVDDASTEITIRIETGPDGAALTGTSTTEAENGTASFTDPVLDLAGPYTLNATADNLTAATTSFRVVQEFDTASYNQALQDTVTVTPVAGGMEITWDPTVYEDVQESLGGILIWRFNSPPERIDEIEAGSGPFENATYLDSDGTDTSVYILTLCSMTGTGCLDPESGEIVASLSEVPGYEDGGEDDWLRSAAGPDVETDQSTNTAILIVAAIVFVVIVAAVGFYLALRNGGSKRRRQANPDPYGEGPARGPGE